MFEHFGQIFAKESKNFQEFPRKYKIYVKMNKFSKNRKILKIYVFIDFPWNFLKPSPESGRLRPRTPGASWLPTPKKFLQALKPVHSRSTFAMSKECIVKPLHVDLHPHCRSNAPPPHRKHISYHHPSLKFSSADASPVELKKF